MQVSVIGSARIADNRNIELAQNIGKSIAQAGYHLVCGGLGGVMLESCRGFKQVERTAGCTVGILPSYDTTTANEFIDVVIPTGLDIGRNHLVVSSGFAVIVIGGGAGTLSEIALASQINKPIILMKGSGGWADKLTERYLDNRCNTQLYHIESVSQLPAILNKLEQQANRSGLVNSGHNHEIIGTR